MAERDSKASWRIHGMQIVFMKKKYPSLLAQYTYVCKYTYMFVSIFHNSYSIILDTVVFFFFHSLCLFRIINTIQVFVIGFKLVFMSHTTRGIYIFILKYVYTYICLYVCARKITTFKWLHPFFVCLKTCFLIGWCCLSIWIEKLQQ